ncbi:hypothetical protein XELAEV_18037579mg [Xenopus laevis]|uniref:Uncharacterized protein n=1 Tax=Xenopus laevis TaxID=8355 RepID=A0A974CDI9_XENLA|nr:hypothetical protein XELAEV_18037579mg [Xenopus laevis]
MLTPSAYQTQKFKYVAYSAIRPNLYVMVNKSKTTARCRTLTAGLTKVNNDFTRKLYIIIAAPYLIKAVLNL